MRPDFSLDGESAVVTGALGRLGPVWVEALTAAGARVLALDRPGVAPDARFQALADRHGEALLRLEADVRDADALRAARDLAARELGPASILVNNAGIDQPPAPGAPTWAIEDFPAELTRQILDVNLVGTVTCSQVFGGPMCRAGRGSIVNIGSVYASRAPDPRYYEHLDRDPPFVKPLAYGASKSAVLGFTRYLAAHWGAHGVRVNALSPGGVLGGQDERFKARYGAHVPLGRLAQEDELGGPLVFLASRAARYVTGIELRVDGGYTAW